MSSLPGLPATTMAPLLVAATCAGVGFLLQAGFVSGEELAAILHFSGAIALFTCARALARCPECRYSTLWQTLLK